MLILFVAIALSAAGQAVRQLYYNDAWRLTKKDAATYYRTCVLDTVSRVFIGEVKDFTSAGTLVMTGFYANGKKNGSFVNFYENGIKASEGPYEEGVRNGAWKYYHQDGSLKYEIEFVSGRPGIRTVRDATGQILTKNGTGTWFEFYDETADTRITVKGQVKDYEYDGTWSEALPDGTVFTASRFANGQFLDGYVTAEGRTFPLTSPLITVLPEGNKHWRTESFSQEPDVSNSDYPFLIRKKLKVGATTTPEPSKEDIFVIVEVAAHPDGGMTAFYKEIKTLLKYPKEARRKKIEGRVFVEFIVNKDGSLSDFKVIKGIGGGCDEAALEAVQESQKKISWVPGIQRRKFVRQRFTLPLQFSL